MRPWPTSLGFWQDAHEALFLHGESQTKARGQEYDSELGAESTRMLLSKCSCCNLFVDALVTAIQLCPFAACGHYTANCSTRLCC